VIVVLFAELASTGGVQRADSGFDFDGADPGFGFGSVKLNGQKTVLEGCTCDFNSFRQNEGTLELPCGDTSMNKRFVHCIGLLAAYHKLIFLDSH